MSELFNHVGGPNVLRCAKVIAILCCLEHPITSWLRELSVVVAWLSLNDGKHLFEEYVVFRLNGSLTRRFHMVPPTNDVCILLWLSIVHSWFEVQQFACEGLLLLRLDQKLGVIPLGLRLLGHKDASAVFHCELKQTLLLY